MISLKKLFKRQESKIRGFFDAIDGSHIVGWVFDSKNPQKRLEVLIYVDGELVAEGIADQYREDLKIAGFGDGRYGFRIKLPDRLLDGKSHKIEVFEKEHSYPLNGSPKEVIFPKIIDKLESIKIIDKLESTDMSKSQNFIEKGAPIKEDEKVVSLGYIELVLYLKEIEKILIIGWYLTKLSDEEIFILVKYPSGTLIESPIRAVRFFRNDVIKMYLTSHFNFYKSGFVFLAKKEFPENILNVSLVSKSTGEIICDTDQIKEISIFEIDSLLGILNGIFIENVEDKIKKINFIDIPILVEICEYKKNLYKKYPTTSWNFGKTLDNPLASIIIPIYKEYLFIDNQMLEFIRDDWLIKNCELIYVLDDPSILTPFLAEMETIYKVYNIPFKVIYGYANRGFSGANNLGARYASGNILIFMNSDVIPAEPGGFRKLIEFLQNSEEVGAVAPLLLFPNGSIQHMGMVFLWSEFYNTFFNHHINMGMSAEKVIQKNEPIEAFMLTGAFICIKKELFESIGGWPEEYVFGDFEDSDFCLSIREKGKKLYVIPEVKMYHLEGASQGFGENRFYRTLINSYILKNKYNLEEYLKNEF